MGSAEDVERLRGELAGLEDRLHRFSKFVEGTDDLLTEVDGTGTLVYVNKTAHKIFGLLPEECVGRKAFDFIHPDDREPTMEAFGGWIEQRLRSAEFENRQVSTTGEVRHLHWTINPHYDDDGNVVTITSIARDVTLRRQMEEQLRRTGEELERKVVERTARLAAEKERLAVTLGSIGDGVITSDAAGRVTMINGAAEALCGWSNHDARGRALPEVFHIINEQTREVCEDPVALVLKSGDMVGLANNTVLIARDGTERIIADSGAPIRDNTGEIVGVVLVFRDSTERVRAAAELKRHRDHLQERVEERTEELQAINRSLAREVEVRRVAEEELGHKARELSRSNEELEQFAYVASHDLQEPLRMISSFSQLLVKQYGGALDDTADEYFGYVVEGASRMQALIHDLLAFSRVNTHGNTFRTTQCGRVLKHVLNDLRVVIDESGAVVTQQDLPTVQGDVAQLTMLFQNLVSNAIKFRGDESPTVSVTARDEGEAWRMSVKDNGIGIAPGYRERIFVIFQRLHGVGDYPGTGIGLAMCKKIVERHGGKIWVESEEGQGCTFHFTLPKTIQVKVGLE